MSLTKRDIEKAKYTGTDNSRCVLWDDDPVGLGVRVFPSGRKSFVLLYRTTMHQKRMMDLGAYGVLTLDQARKLANAALVGVDTGADPLEDRKAQELEARTGMVEGMFRAYVAAVKPKRAKELLQSAELHIFSSFGARPWRGVRRSEVREWHKAIERPYAANRALQAFRAAIYWRLWQEDDAPGNKQSKRDTRNPCAGIELRPEKPRQVRLEVADLPKLEHAIDAETSDPYLRTFFRFLLATGCRRGEALKLEWQDVRLGGEAAVTFRDTKNSSDHKVPLSAHAVKLLTALLRIEGNPFVFVGHKHGDHLQEPNKAWDRIRKSAGLNGLRIHDLRRSFGSWLGDGGFTSKQVGAVLGHRTDITSRHYMALGTQSQRAAVDAVSTMMKGNKAKVRPIRKVRA